VSGKAAPHLRDVAAKEEQRRLSKEELLRPRILEEDVEIEALGGTVRIKSLSHAARQDIRTKSGWGGDAFDEDRMNCLGIVFSLVDPKLTEDDIAALREQDQGIFDELVLKISLLNMLGRTEELKKDSSETPSSDSA
jgi:hypothetical protein